jgi:hypothetical protein
MPAVPAASSREKRPRSPRGRGSLGRRGPDVGPQARVRPALFGRDDGQGTDDLSRDRATRADPLGDGRSATAEPLSEGRDRGRRVRRLRSHGRVTDRASLTRKQRAALSRKRGGSLVYAGGTRRDTTSQVMGLGQPASCWADAGSADQDDHPRRPGATQSGLGGREGAHKQGALAADNIGEPRVEPPEAIPLPASKQGRDLQARPSPFASFRRLY